ncbi:hypothetical protein [Asticcacaulis solisilvae]|uniref:hypothetical protein n=1 Tax=Asticcacaulis solisilvae TaxID=1217274 RepID=UPI003FD89F20
MHGAIPKGFKYLPLPPGQHVAVAFFTRTPDSQFPYDAQISVLIDRAGPATLIDSQYNRVWDNYRTGCVGKSEARVLSSGTQNNYPYSEWLLSCDADKEARGPRFSVMKTVVGQSLVYVYEYEMHSGPDDAAVKAIRDYLDSEMLCDDTSASHPCQTTGN